MDTLSYTDTLKTKLESVFPFWVKQINYLTKKGIQGLNNQYGESVSGRWCDINAKMSKGNKLSGLIYNSFCPKHSYRAQSKPLSIWMCLI